MNLVNGVGLILSILVIVFLVIALIRSEKF
ncbi:MAG TPA: potassium-transporting ATPase subunit F [Jatrophihabitans sp.]